MPQLEEIKRRIIEKREETPDGRSLLVGLSGIDASGKGYIAARLAEVLATELKLAVINIDGWLNLPHVRFSDIDPGRHFYNHAFRFEEMFDRLILPLAKDRKVNVKADFAEETAAEFRPHKYVFDDIDLILLEGIFLFKNECAGKFDLRIWVECRFETALKRAVARSQEGLSPEQTITAYEQIYFPAQRIHFECDRPIESADILFDND